MPFYCRLEEECASIKLVSICRKQLTALPEDGLWKHVVIHILASNSRQYFRKDPIEVLFNLSQLQNMYQCIMVP